MGSLDEVEQNVKAGTDYQTLSGSEQKRLFEAADGLSRTFCRQCEYCLPCEQGIDIVTVFILDKHYTRFGARESARQRYAALPVKADKCTKCGECEARCPYELPIREMLKAARQRLE